MYQKFRRGAAALSALLLLCLPACSREEAPASSSGYGFYFFCCFLFDGGVHTADADADTNRFPDRGADGQADEKDHRSHDDNCADNGCPHDSGGSRRHRHHSRRENHGGDLPPA